MTFKDSIDSLALYNSQVNINLADINIGGKNGELLYVLDRIRGVTIFEIYMAGDYKKILNSKIGLIDVQ